MKNEKIYSALYDYCRWDQPESVTRALEDSPIDIDVTYNNGIFFRLAISAGSTEILSALLQYFEKTRLHDDCNTSKYLLAKFQLRNILKSIIDEFDVSNEIRDLLEPYLGSRDDSSNNTDEDSEFENDPFMSDEDIDYILDVGLIGNTDQCIY